MEELAGVSGEGAQRLLAEAAVLVALHVPRGTQLGLDLKAWHTDGDFRGFKLVPPGVHYVHWASAGPHGDDVAPRVGFVHHFKPREILVKLWDKEQETFSNDMVNEETIDRLRGNLCNLDRFLAPYPFDILPKWKALSSHISANLAEKITPEIGQIRSALELISCNDNDRPKGENRKISKTKLSITEVTDDVINPETSSTNEMSQNSENQSVLVKNTLPKRRSRTLTAEEKEEELLPNLKPTPGTELRFSVFPERNYPIDATPAEITKHHLDQSYVLDFIIKRHKRPLDIIGELQFAYVCFLIGHSLDAFEYWKKLVCLFCSCEDALSKYCTVYLNFTTVLELQLMEIPEEFLADIVMNENVIYVSLRKLCKIVYDANVDARLKSAIDRLQSSLTEKFMWNFTNLDVDEEDELPVIVHL